MSRVNKDNYIERKRGLSWRDWWLGKIARVELNVIIPPRLYGKRFKIKVEVVEDVENKDDMIVFGECNICGAKVILFKSMFKIGVRCRKQSCDGYMNEVER